jgi:3-oxoadipate enol-lactonase
MHYLTAGVGQRAVVFVHGWSAFKEIWWAAIQAVAPYAHAFAPDLPGHGASATWAAHPVSTMRDVAERIAAFCAAHELKEIALVGHSMGGNIAVELALAHPELVKQLVLVNPALQGPQMPAYTRAYLLRDHGWLALRASIILARGVGLFSDSIPHLHGGGLVRPTMRRLGYMGRHDPELLHRLLGALIQNDLVPRLPQLTQPALVLAGQFDPLVPASMTRRAARSIPGARFYLLPRSGHNPMDEQPALFESLLTEFLGFRQPVR